MILPLRRPVRNAVIVVVAIFALLVGGGVRPVPVAAQNVDYISAGSAAALDLGFPVLVPSWVPAPFGGEPSIDGGGGSYSLYWMNGGGDPTFLQVTGVVGGGLPTGSPYDLNIQLSINASVNGLGAIHDVTPIYDAVWWIQGGVLYSVQSRNMTGSDSLSLANSLVTFVPPAVEPEPEPTSPPAPDPDPGSDQGPDQGTGGDTGSEQPPSDSTGDGTSTESDVPASGEQDTDETADVPSDTGDAEEVTPVPVGSDGTGEPVVASDGTGGPPAEVAPSDGTGGGNDVIVIPRKTPDSSPLP